MIRRDVLAKAWAGAITWEQAALICRISARQMRRLRARWDQLGDDGLVDRRLGKSQPRRIAEHVVREVCRLKKERYYDFSIRHFHQFLVEQHGIAVSYTWTRNTLLAHGLAYRATGRGKYRRRRPRRPMTGMLVHLDASTHAWIEGLPNHDLVVALDDADGRILYARFCTQESTLSTLHALKHVLERYGRFCELYTDRGSHFCNTTKAKDGPDGTQDGTVPRVLQALGIRQIFAYSPQARGRSERAFGTIQERLPAELRLHNVKSYGEANDYLDSRFIADFNGRFTVVPEQPETAFVPLAGIDLELLLSVQHARVVRNDNTILFRSLVLQIPRAPHRIHFVRCTVVVHEFPDETLGISHDGLLLGRFGHNSHLIRDRRPRWARVSCQECERIVRHDHTVFFKNLVLEIPVADHRAHFVGCRVTVHDYEDGIIDISHDGIIIGRYRKNSNSLHRRQRVRTVPITTASPGVHSAGEARHDEPSHRVHASGS